MCSVCHIFFRLDSASHMLRKCTINLQHLNSDYIFPLFQNQKLLLSSYRGKKKRSDCASLQFTCVLVFQCLYHELYIEDYFASTIFLVFILTQPPYLTCTCTLTIEQSCTHVFAVPS